MTRLDSLGKDIDLLSIARKTWTSIEIGVGAFHGAKM